MLLFELAQSRVHLIKMSLLFIGEFLLLVESNIFLENETCIQEKAFPFFGQSIFFKALRC
jgi:hypothetical protein